MVLSVDTPEDTDSIPRLEFYGGIIAPAFTEIVTVPDNPFTDFALSRKYRLGTGFICLVNAPGDKFVLTDTGYTDLSGSTTYDNPDDLPLCYRIEAAGSLEPIPDLCPVPEKDIIVSSPTYNYIQDHLQRAPYIPLKPTLNRLTRNNARAAGIGHIAGSFEAGKYPGAVLIEGIDWENTTFTERTSFRRIL